MQMLLSGRTPAIFISLGNVGARRFNLGGILVSLTGAYAAEAPSTKPNQNTQEQRPHCFAPHIISTDATNAGGLTAAGWPLQPSILPWKIAPAH
jgi:hypothetical protein